jgi:hypothetical protein
MYIYAKKAQTDITAREIETLLLELETWLDAE